MKNRTHLSEQAGELAPAYAIAVAAPILAALLRAALSPLLNDRAVLMIYLVAVLFAASRGGLGPGLVSTAISLGFGAWTYLQLGGFDAAALTHLAIFSFCAVAISFIGRAMRQAILREHRRTVDLRISETKHRRMADCGLIGLIEWRADGVITDANDLFLNLLGYSRDRLRQGSLRWREMTPPEHHAADTRSLEALRTRGVVAPYEKEFFRKDGSRVWVLIGNARYEDSNDGFSVVIDIAERKRADDQLQRNRDTFYNLIQNNPFGIYVVDADFRLSQASVGSQKVFETVRPLLGRDFAEVLRQVWAEPFATQAINIFRHTLETGEPFSSPSTVERRQDIGEIEAYDWRIERITLPDGRYGVVCYFYDLSERQKLEAAVRESEERFELATRATSDAIWDWDLVKNTAWWNEGFGRLTGFAAEEAGAAEWWLDKIHPEDRGRVEASIYHAIDHGGATTWREEYRFRRHDGTYTSVLDRGYVLRDANGKALRMIGGMQDLTERHRAEQALRESEAFYRKTLESIPGMVFTTTADGQCDYLSRQWIEFTGIEEEPQHGLGWLQVVHPEDRTRLGAEWVAAAKSADRYETEYRIRNRQGRYEWFKVRARAIRDSAGQVANWLGTATNVEDFKRTESALRRAQEQLADANDQLFSRARQLDKLVEQRTEQLRDAVQQLETFSYSIVHDMRAPLRSMRSFAQLLVEEHSDNLDRQARQYLARIQAAAGRMDALITDVLSYSRISSTPIDPNSVDLDRLLHDMVEQYPQLQENASAIEIASPLPRVSGNPALLTQVFSNLLGNALKFIPRDRTARVAVRAEPSNGHVRVWVEDNGIGIRAEHRDQIFGLFQRLHTNEQYPGTGVGLAIVRKAVERMGGKVGLESEEGQGTRFWVDLRPAPPKEKSLDA